MTSRALRRVKAKKSETGSEVIEKKRTAHPLLYGFSIILLVVVVVTFVGSPVAGRLTQGNNVVFGTYDGRDIAFSQGGYFAEQQAAIYQQLRDSAGADQDLYSLAQSATYQAYRQAALRVGMLVQGEKAGLHVSEDSLDKALLMNPAYTENGRFSETLYTRTAGTEKERIRKLAREESLSGLYLRDMFTGLKTGTKEKDFVTAMAKSQRSFSLASFPYTAFPSSEIRGFGETNRALFRRIKVSRILVTSGEKEAKEIRRKIAEKVSSFEELAKAHSKDGYKDNGGDMGWRYAYDLESDFEKKEQASAVFALKAGEVSDVAKGGFGWLMYRVDAEPVDPDFTDAAVLDVVKAYLVTYEKGKIEDYFVAKGREFSRRANEVGLAAAARQAGVTPVATDFFPINLQNVFSFMPLKAVDETSTPATAIYSEDFFAAAFSLPKDTVSDPVVLDDQVMVLGVLAERQMPDTTAVLVGSWLEYIASQTMQADLQNQLMDPAKLKDNFMEAFTKLYGRPQKG